MTEEQTALGPRASRRLRRRQEGDRLAKEARLAPGPRPADQRSYSRPVNGHAARSLSQRPRDRGK